ncbi:MAG: acyltransferase [Actinomycetota bacterium]|nr:acyltransferase [Actinomycetota bacterium]
MTVDAAPTARSLAAATRPDRDRYVDLLRVFAIGTVVLGHWLMAVVAVDRQGRVGAGNALTSVPALQYATWLLQVMPLFFFVGGFAHFTGMQARARRTGRAGGAYAEFVTARITRLLRPTALFVSAWLAVSLALELLGWQSGVAALAVRTVAQPLWFLGVYLGVMALAPLMLRWHRRQLGWVPVQLGLGVIAVDAAAFGLHLPGLRMVNVALVWLTIHQFGYLYADGILLCAGRRVPAAMVIGGLLTVLALTLTGTYPVSMVGMPGERVSNMNPPTVALLAHAVWLVGLALLLRGPLSRWLRHRRVWTAVIAANGVVMTVFLWHLTALFAVYAVILGGGWAGMLPAAGSPWWWGTRPLWLAGLAAVGLVLVAVCRRAERPRLMPPAPPMGGPRAAVAATACCLGVLGFSATGFGGLLTGHSVSLAGLPMTAPAAAALMFGGWAMLSGRTPNNA